jgi:hypothetical protein
MSTGKTIKLVKNQKKEEEKRTVKYGKTSF